MSRLILFFFKEKPQKQTTSKNWSLLLATVEKGYSRRQPNAY